MEPWHLEEPPRRVEAFGQAGQVPTNCNQNRLSTQCLASAVLLVYMQMPRRRVSEMSCQVGRAEQRLKCHCESQVSPQADQDHQVLL